MPIITVKVAKDGETTVKVDGVAGPGCRDLSANIEKALGREIRTEPTSEYYQEAQSQEQQAGQG